jgi:hypothetical protein
MSQCRAFRHASCATTRAEATELAAERDQVFMMTLVALHAHKSMFQAAAFEVVGKFLLYMKRQRVALHGHHIPELWVMPLDDLIEKCLFRPVTLIRWTVWRPVRDRGMRHIVLLSVERHMFS